MSLARFTKVYNSLPISERDMVCCVYAGQGISWNLAYDYLRSRSPEGQEIQRILEQSGRI